MINFFKSGGTFTNIDITKLEGYASDNDTRNDIAWTTEKIDNVLKEYRDGNIELSRIKSSPFLQNNIELRKPNLTYLYTNEELMELKRCSKDPIYFADKYGKLFTENGYQHIKVRDYQQGLLEGMYEHKKCILMCSRQLGKCFLGDSKIKIRNKKTGEIIETRADEFFEKIKNKK